MERFYDHRVREIVIYKKMIPKMLLIELPWYILNICMMFAREDGWAMALTCRTILNAFKLHPLQLRVYSIASISDSSYDTIIECHDFRENAIHYHQMMADAYSRLGGSYKTGYNRPIIVSSKVGRRVYLQQQHVRLYMIDKHLDRLGQHVHDDDEKYVCLSRKVKEELVELKKIKSGIH